MFKHEAIDKTWAKADKHTFQADWNKALSAGYKMKEQQKRKSLVEGT